MRAGARGRKNFFARKAAFAGRVRVQNFFKISRERVCCAAVGRVSCAARGDEGCAALGGRAVRGSLLHCAESFRAFCPLMRLPALMRSSAVFLAARIFLKIALVKIVQLYPCGFLQPAWLFLPLLAERRAFRRGFKASEGAPAPARKAGCLAAFRGACARPKFS